MYLIKILSVAGAIIDSKGLVGGYLRRYDPEAHDGQGHMESTNDVAEAVRFETVADALRAYQAVPKKRPRRPDGRPNKPLTAFTIEVVEAPK